MAVDFDAVNLESGLSLKPYDADAAAILLPLTRAALGDSGAVRKTDEFWRWKHHANPFGESVGRYAWDEDAQRAAALRILLRWQFRAADGRLLQAARAVDTATHPDYQRQGLFRQLTLEAIDGLRSAGFDFIYNTPNAKSLPGYLKMGWQVVAQWPLYIKPLRPLRMAGRRLRRAAKPTLAFESFFAPAIQKWAAFQAEYGDQIDGLVEDWERQRACVGLRTQRSTPYLAWRYGGHPNIDYAFYPLDEGGQLRGFAVLRPNIRFGWQETVLTELFLAKASPELSQRLMRGLLNAARGDYVIAHFNEGSVERQILRSSRFLRAPRQSITFTARSLQPETPALFSPSAWDLSLGDLEIF